MPVRADPCRVGKIAWQCEHDWRRVAQFCLRACSARCPTYSSELGMRFQTSMTPDGNQVARELLGFYLEAGVDAVLGETAVDRFADAAEMSAPRALGRPAAGSPPASDPGTRPVLDGGRRAAAAVAAPAPLSPDTAVMTA